MPDSKRLIRQWTLLRTLSTRREGATYEELAHETGFDRRTIQRDLPFLAKVGFPLKETLGHHGVKHWRIDDKTGIAQLQFTLEEAVALYLGRQFLEPLAGTLFHAGAASAYGKIRSGLSEIALRHIEKLAATFYQTRQGWADYSAKAELIDDLAVGVEDRRLTVITYQSLRSTEEVTFYDVYPYALIHHRGALYLIAHSRDHDAVRTFKVDRISSVKIHELKFAVPSNFDPERFLQNSFGIFEGHGDPVTVRISFRAKVSRILAEKRFHPSQKLHRLRDGSVIAEYTLSESDKEFIAWILSYGAEAEVLEPASLREHIATTLRDTLRRYEQPVTNESPIHEPSATNSIHEQSHENPESRNLNKRQGTRARRPR